MKKTIKKTVDEKKLEREAKKAARLKKREMAKAKRLKAIEKHKKQVEANKLKRAEKKAKKLAKLEKERAKKAAIREAKKIAHQKKLEREAKKKAKAKELKLKARAKAKDQKQKNDAKVKTTLANIVENTTINKVVNALKTYAKNLAKDAINLDAKKTKKLEKLGFTIEEDTINFAFSLKRKASKPLVKKIEVAEPEIVEDKPIEDTTIEATIEQVVGDEAEVLEKLADEIEEDAPTETPVGDTFTDDVVVPSQPNGFEDDEEDDTIDDNRDETDEDKIGFRRDWNNEFGDDGERDENW